MLPRSMALWQCSIYVAGKGWPGSDRTTADCRALGWQGGHTPLLSTDLRGGRRGEEPAPALPWQGPDPPHLDVDVEIEEVVARAEEGAVHRDSLARVAGDGDPDQVVATDNAVGRVELDPAGGRQVDLRPGVGGAGTLDVRALAVQRRVVEVAGGEAGTEAQATRRLHEQERQVAAGAAAPREGLGRRPGAVLVPGLVGELAPDGPRHRGQEVERPHARVRELAGPGRDGPVLVGVVALAAGAEVDQVVGAVVERVGLGREVDQVVR